MIAGLVLAAGESSRMGTDKALLKFCGRTFLETVVEKLREGGIERVVVVLGHHAQEIRDAVELTGALVVVNADYRRGQTSSLQAGLKALAGSNPEGVVLALVDHPAFKPETVRQLVAAFRASNAAVTIPTYEGHRGHPVVIDCPLFQELNALNPGEGANTVLRKYRQQTRWVEVADPGILLDVDDPESYSKLTIET